MLAIVIVCDRCGEVAEDGYAKVCHQYEYRTLEGGRRLHVSEWDWCYECMSRTKGVMTRYDNAGHPVKIQLTIKEWVDCDPQEWALVTSNEGNTPCDE